MRKIIFIVFVGIVISTGCSNNNGKDSRKEIADQNFREWSSIAAKTLSRDSHNLAYGMSQVGDGDYETLGKMGGILKDDATRLLFEVRRMKVSEKYQKIYDFQILYLENYKKAGEVIEIGAPIRDPDTLMEAIKEAMEYVRKGQTSMKLTMAELSNIDK